MGLVDSVSALACEGRNLGEVRQALIDTCTAIGLGAGSDGKLDDVVEFQNGYAFKSGWYEESGVRLLRNANVGHGSLTWRDTAHISASRAEEFERFRLKEGDIVLSLDRPLISTGLKIARIDKHDLPALLLQRVARLNVKNGAELSAAYLYLWLQSSWFLGALDPGRSKGVPHVSTRQLRDLHFTPGSSAAQAKAVEAWSHLSGRAEELGRAWHGREAAQKETIRTCLHALVAHGEWDRVHDNWDYLFTASDSLDELRWAIRVLATRRGLGTRDCGDAPITDAIVKGNAEVQDYFESVAGRARKRGRAADTGVDVIGDGGLCVGEPPRPAPDGWQWVRLTDVARLESGHTPSRKKAEYWSEGTVPWIGIRDARRHDGGVIHTTEQMPTELGIANSSARLLPAGTVCLSRTASVGYVVVMGEEMATSQDFVNWVTSSAVEPHYLALVLQAEKRAWRRFSKGAVHQTIYYPAVKAFTICLPPPAEQRRIVEKVDELMALCSDLEARLCDVEGLSEKLAAAVVKRSAYPEGAD